MHIGNDESSIAEAEKASDHLQSVAARLAHGAAQRLGNSQHGVSVVISGLLSATIVALDQMGKNCFSYEMTKDERTAIAQELQDVVNRKIQLFHARSSGTAN